METIYTVFIRNKKYPERVQLVMSAYGENELQAFLDIIAEKIEPPYNKTAVVAALHARGLKVNRFHMDCDFYVLANHLKVITANKEGIAGCVIKPLYSKATVKNGVVRFD